MTAYLETMLNRRKGDTEVIVSENIWPFDDIICVNHRQEKNLTILRHCSHRVVSAQNVGLRNPIPLTLLTKENQQNTVNMKNNNSSNQINNESVYSELKQRSHITCIVLFCTILSLISGCAATPLTPYSTDSPPLVLVPAAEAGVNDKRGRFREIFCQILAERGGALPDYRPCEKALTRVGDEAGGNGKRVEMGPSRSRLIAALVPGVGWDCFGNWLQPAGTAGNHIRQYGYDLVPVAVDSLSSSTSNARQIRDAIIAIQLESIEPRIVLIGYSKGLPDILEAIVSFPEIRSRIAAVIGAAGAVGGSPLANDAEQSDLAFLQNWPGAECSPGDGGAIDSLIPQTRQAWNADNPLPKDIRYYSLVTFPEPEEISSVLMPTYRKLSSIDPRNDGQLLFYDQVISNSTLIGYLNADHWALAVPIGRTHPFLGRTFMDKNAYPREALLESVLRFVEEDLADRDSSRSASPGIGHFRAN